MFQQGQARIGYKHGSDLHLPICNVSITRRRHLALREVKPCVIQLCFNGRNVALGRLHSGFGLLRGSLRLRQGGFSLLNRGVRFLAFLRMPWLR